MFDGVQALGRDSPASPQAGCKLAPENAAAEGATESRFGRQKLRGRRISRPALGGVGGGKAQWPPSPNASTASV